MTEQKKWYPIKLISMWIVSDNPNREQHTDVMDEDHVGEEQARSNAILCSKAPEMKELLDEIIDELCRNCTIPGYEDWKYYQELKERHEKLCKELDK